MDAAVVERIKKLLRLAQSSNIHEAELALARAFNLAARHHIDRCPAVLDRVCFLALAKLQRDPVDEPLDESAHCPSGSLNGSTPGMTVDLVRDEARQPKIVASADCLPFDDGAFDLVLSDPPYSKADAARYGTPPYPLKRSMDEFGRVLAPGGYFGLLHFFYPPFRRANWQMVALIGVCVGSNRKMRMFAVFQKQ